MPLDIARPRQQTTTAELHYLMRAADKPTRYAMEPPPGVPVWNGIDDPHTVLIEDARGREPEFTLDRNGFTLTPARLSRFTTQKSSACCAIRSAPRASSCSITMCVMEDAATFLSLRARCTMTIPSKRPRDGCATI
jgi:hypothetical protein